jgi:hypothetical protein
LVLENSDNSADPKLPSSDQHGRVALNDRAVEASREQHIASL